MIYTLSYSNPDKHYIDIQVQISTITTSHVEVQLPAWRPGRYEMANFAKNMTLLKAYGTTGEKLNVQKLTKDCWRIQTETYTSVQLNYSYYAQQMDAGGSWLDDKQLYVNFVNCLVHVKGRMQEECRIQLQLPENYKIACGLPEISKHVLIASDYYQLVDSPMIASATLQKYSYQIQSTTFYIWVQGECHLNWEKVKLDFIKFSEVQMQMMQGFPCEAYHFLFHWLPFQHYHGVEHQNSTVITLGPASQAEQLYGEMLGISSHELFHTWNVIRIRPAELLPYDFSKENYFSTGFVAEGITTYYGDLFLARAGIFYIEEYLQELSQTLNKHFKFSNRSSLSLIDSSFDLWLDGYTMGAPGRKVSIYNKGALAALILDLEIRQLTQNTRSLDDVMRELWKQFGDMNAGYTIQDYQQIIEKVAGQNYQDYFDECIFGTIPLQDRTSRALNYVGCELAILQALPDSENIEITIRLKETITETEKENLQKWLENAR
ncbi:M61 family metallopeptidase [Rhodocytophaga rosea]|uniref:M61 family metallopeptidase n=1 Tax=Rhodocytophaga rosea TaxID=2704465 RepID=A0A6C0GLA0_9BACT|nr:M61 family metallopeptidase [Rhodocytophaga rosea]QHT68727.1 M61 family metallopeptidase [Rhodocytophaga rosea]